MDIISYVEILYIFRHIISYIASLQTFINDFKIGNASIDYSFHKLVV